jgi:hypothetical protein
LGVEVNLTKSISSPSKPVFEFAKRTYNNGVDVSPVPFKPLIHPSLADLVGNFLLFSKKGLISTSGILVSFLTRFGLPKHKELVHPILAVLGAYTTKGILPHRRLVELLVDPKDEEFDFDSSSLTIPLESSIKLILDGSRGVNLEEQPYPFSNRDFREEIYDDYEDEFANVVANEALVLGRKLEQDYDSIMESCTASILRLAPEMELVTVAEKTNLKTEGILGSLEG